MQSFKRVACPRKDLQLEPTLNGGQCFRWKRSEGDVWTGVINNTVWKLSQTDDHLLYERHLATHQTQSVKEIKSSKKRNVNGDFVSSNEDESVLKNYFRLDVNLQEFYNLWSDADIHFKESANRFYGVRILNQDVVENLFSFICSSNNNISRISSMVEKLCSMYGSKIAVVNNQEYFNFPCLDKLAEPGVESELRNAGFGYRAKFIHKSATMILENGGNTWLEDLKALPYQKAKTELMKLPGIGAKVADCICLMSLGHMEAIPVDTHIFQIASQRYLPHLKNCKSVTDRVYNEIGDHFRELYGSHAGWAHTVLFCADLKMFQEKPKEKQKRPKRQTKKQ